MLFSLWVAPLFICCSVISVIAHSAQFLVQFGLVYIVLHLHFIVVKIVSGLSEISIKNYSLTYLLSHCIFSVLINIVYGVNYTGEIVYI